MPVQEHQLKASTVRHHLLHIKLHHLQWCEHNCHLRKSESELRDEAAISV